jgi:hypothetical protein
MTSFAIVALSILLASSAAARAEPLVYASYASDHDSDQFVDEIELDFDSEKLRIGHSTQKLKKCPPSASMYCFTSLAISFAVPKRGLADATSWQHDGHQYVVASRQPIRMMGKTIDVFVISSKISDTREDRFFYSIDRGLLIIASIEEKSRARYRDASTVQQYRGFPYAGTKRH